MDERFREDPALEDERDDADLDELVSEVRRCYEACFLGSVTCQPTDSATRGWVALPDFPRKRRGRRRHRGRRARYRGSNPQ